MGEGLDRATLRLVVDEAKRAPSPLNTQPARWRLRDGHLELIEEPARRLFASDPSGRDHRLALGAAWEGTRLALGARGLRLVDEVGAHVADAGVIARARVVSGGARDPLVDVVQRRATWRGLFRPADPGVLATLGGTLAREGAALFVERQAIDDAAALIDESIVRSLLLPRALEEMRDWMRTARHPCVTRDGVTPRTLHLSAVAANALARPPWFDRLARLGIAQHLVSERRQTASASALVALTAPVDEPLFVTGGRFYRAWLHVTAAGLHACPMRVVTATDALNERFVAAAQLDGGQRLMHLWRIGVASGVPRRTPRLPTEELVL